jgi:hypothetical protein
MLAYAIIKFNDNFECNKHQFQQSAQSRREVRVRHPSDIQFHGHDKCR